jgi:hypothetical protein
VSGLSSSGGRKSRNNKDGHDSTASSTVAVEAYLEQANATQAALLLRLNEAAQDRKRKLKKKMVMAERNSRFERRLQIDKALNDIDELNLLLHEAKSTLMNDDSNSDDIGNDSNGDI